MHLVFVGFVIACKSALIFFLIFAFFITNQRYFLLFLQILLLFLLFFLLFLSLFLMRAPHLAEVSPVVLQDMYMLPKMLSDAVPIEVLLTSACNMTGLVAVRTEHVVVTVLLVKSLFLLPSGRGAFLDYQCKILDLIYSKSILNSIFLTRTSVRTTILGSFLDCSSSASNFRQRSNQEQKKPSACFRSP